MKPPIHIKIPSDIVNSNSINNNKKYIGENGHFEYGWSNEIREKILQFYFQITRTDESGIENLSTILKQLLISLKNKKESFVCNEERNEYLSILFRMIGHTRDIIEGKGECTLAYMMIHRWYNYYPDLSLFALTCMVTSKEIQEHPYGSWKDIKYFCGYCRKQGENEEHPLIKHAISLANTQLKKDYINYVNNLNNISLVSKWIPRESSSLGWLFSLMAINYFSEYVKTAQTIESHIKSILKCKTEYRKIISCLNKKIDTLEVKLCNSQWSNINFNNVTSVSLLKQNNVFLNIKQNGDIRHLDNIDRIHCSNNIKKYIENINMFEKEEIKGKRIGIEQFTKQALKLINNTNNNNNNNNNSVELDYQKKLLNFQWINNCTQSNTLGNFIPMIDVSESLDSKYKHAAVSLGIRVAEKSKLGKRILTFSGKPKWINLESCNDFVSMVDYVYQDIHAINKNFYEALNFILDAIIDTKLSPEEVQDMVLVVFSDMQVEQSDVNMNKESMYHVIKEKYATIGIRLYKKSLKPPHILFWNLRSTDGFPCLSLEKNVSMMSGFNPSLLNSFCEKGICGLFNSSTPWSILIKTLKNKRYKMMGDKIKNM